MPRAERGGPGVWFMLLNEQGDLINLAGIRDPTDSVVSAIVVSVLKLANNACGMLLCLRLFGEPGEPP